MARRRPKPIVLTPVASLREEIEGGEVVSFGVGPDGVTYVAIARDPVDLRARFPMVAELRHPVIAEVSGYRILALAGAQRVLDVSVEPQPFLLHHVQPLAGALLLACARTRSGDPPVAVRNGRVYTADGTFVRDLWLGDAIEALQVTSADVIWASYFDEGVGDREGWDGEYGCPGLAAWDAAGRMLWGWPPSLEVDPIYDCYALNVASDEDVWAYYYDAFPLVHMHQRALAGVWRMPLPGCGVFAVSDGYALFGGGYDDRAVYELFSLGAGGEVGRLGRFELFDEQGCRIDADDVAGRGARIQLLHCGQLYAIGVEEALAQL